MNNFICRECGTKYSSPEETPPPGIKWSDGHVCTPESTNPPSHTIGMSWSSKLNKDDLED